jgi:hypothetical protein
VAIDDIQKPILSKLDGRELHSIKKIRDYQKSGLPLDFFIKKKGGMNNSHFYQHWSHNRSKNNHQIMGFRDIIKKAVNENEGYQFNWSVVISH